MMTIQPVQGEVCFTACHLGFEVTGSEVDIMLQSSMQFFTSPKWYHEHGKQKILLLFPFHSILCVHMMYNEVLKDKNFW